MITGNLSIDILVVYLPAVLAIFMGILGLLRGARREAVVSGAIVLAALIIIIWGVPWATDLHNIFPNLSIADSRNVLAYVVMGLAVLVIGYMLGSALVPRTPLRPLSRIGGFLLGVANGLAIAGYFIRGQYESAVLDPTGANTDLVAVLTSNDIARYLWIWANWFPLVVAIIAAIVALVGPFRRAQTTVATPAAGTDWGPSAAPAVGATMAAPGPAAYTTGYGQGFTSQYPQQPGPQYGQQYPQAPTQPNQYAPPSQPYSQYPPLGQQPAPVNPPPASPQAYSSPPYAPAPPPQARMGDAPPTMPMPQSDISRSTPPGGQETHYFGTTPAAQPKDTGPQAKAPEWSGYNEPSWLTSGQSGSSAPSSPQLDSSLVTRAEAPTQAQPIIPPAANADDGDATADQDSSSFVNCSRCGTLVPSDATFCTECGNRLKV